MNFKKEPFVMFALIAAGMLVLAGCQTIRESNSRDKEEMLAAAGFQMKLAETPEQLANIEKMQQRKLVPHVKEGRNMYIYADAEFCHCVYVGTEENYQQYEGMVYQKELADQKQATAQMESENFINESAMMDWDVWGPWEPWR